MFVETRKLKRPDVIRWVDEMLQGLDFDEGAFFRVISRELPLEDIDVINEEDNEEDDENELIQEEETELHDFNI